jgi:DNA-directed RNA polymerase subunit M
VFCTKCRTMMRIREEKGKRILACGSCGFVDRLGELGKIKEAVISSSSKVEVADGEEDNILPTTKANCPKCGHHTAQFWLVQTRAGDEPETKFLKCEKCRHTWRDYS